MKCRLPSGRSQDILWGCTVFLEKVDHLVLVVALKTQAKTTKLITTAVQIFSGQQKFPLKIGLLLCLGMHLQLFPVN